MARNGSGTYTLPQPPFVPGTTIAASPMNSDLSDIAAALTQSISKDGQTVYTGNQPMGGNRHTGVSAGTATDQYPSIAQIVAGSLLAVSSETGVADAYVIAPAIAITAYAAFQVFTFIPGNANTGPATLSVSGLTAKNVFRPGLATLAAGDIAAGGLLTVMYDGTQFIIMSGGGAQIGYNFLTTRGDLLTRNASTIVRLPIGAANRLLKSDGTDAAWGLADLTASVTGVLPVANGGSGVASQPKFSAWQSVAQTGVANATYTKITLTTEEYDVGGYYASSRYTPLVAGYYRFSGSALFTAGGAYTTSIALYKNGSVAKEGVFATGSRPFVSATILLNGSTDYVELFALQNSGGASDVSNSQSSTYFQAEFVGS